MTTTQYRTTRTRRPLLHVLVTAYDHVGKPLHQADVDAVSTADAMAYFVTSRGIDSEATEVSILKAMAWDRPNLRPPGDREDLFLERRDAITGALELQVKATVTWAPAP